MRRLLFVLSLAGLISQTYAAGGSFGPMSRELTNACPHVRSMVTADAINNDPCVKVFRQVNQTNLKLLQQKRKTNSHYPDRTRKVDCDTIKNDNSQKAVCILNSEL